MEEPRRCLCPGGFIPDQSLSHVPEAGEEHNQSKGTAIVSFYLYLLLLAGKFCFSQGGILTICAFEHLSLLRFDNSHQASQLSKALIWEALQHTGFWRQVWLTLGWLNTEQTPADAVTCGDTQGTCSTQDTRHLRGKRQTLWLNGRQCK